MKINHKQLEVLNLISDQVEFWKSTKDINSPTHLCDIDETLNLFRDEYDLSDSDIDNLSKSLKSLYLAVKKLS